MASDQEVLERVSSAKERFGPKLCGKFSGAVTVEEISAGLCEAGLPVSDRDVFIRGVQIEIDLLVVRPGIETLRRLLYEPAKVLPALEIKNIGSFGQATIDKIRSVSSSLK